MQDDDFEREQLDAHIEELDRQIDIKNRSISDLHGEYDQAVRDGDKEEQQDILDDLERAKRELADLIDERDGASCFLGI